VAQNKTLFIPDPSLYSRKQQLYFPKVLQGDTEGRCRKAWLVTENGCESQSQQGSRRVLWRHRALLSVMVRLMGKSRSPCVCGRLLLRVLMEE